MSEMTHLGAVSSQTSVDAAAFITDEHPSVDGGPARLRSAAVRADLSAPQSLRHLSG